MENLVTWSQDKNLFIVNKMKPLVIDFGKHGGVYVPISISSADVKMVESFLGINIFNDLSLTNRIDAIAKKAH